MTEKRVLREIKDFTHFRPKLISDYVAQQVIKTDGEYYYLKNPILLKYITLNANEFYLFQHMSGKLNFEDLVRLHFENTKELSSSKVKNLIFKLARNGFIENSQQLWDITPIPEEKFSTDNFFVNLFRGVRLFHTGFFTAETLFQNIYNYFGKITFSLIMISIILLLSAVGIAVFLYEFVTVPYSFFEVNGSYGVGFTLMLVVFTLILFLRTYTKGLALKELKRMVLDFEFRILYSTLWPRVEDKDIIMSSRKDKVYYYTMVLITFLVPIAVVTPWLIIYQGEWGLELQVSSAIVFVSLISMFLFLTPFFISDGVKLFEEVYNLSDLKKRTATFFQRRFFPLRVKFSSGSYREELIYIIVGLYGIIWLAGLFVLLKYLFNTFLFYDFIEKVYYLNPGILDIFVFDNTVYEVLSVMSFVLIVIGLLIFVSYMIIRILISLYVILFTISQSLASGKSVVSSFENSLLDEVKNATLFNAIDEREIEQIATHIKLEKYPKGRNIITQGEKGNKFYVIRKGKVDVIYEEKSGIENTVAELSEGDCFGEIALIDDVRRTATVRAVSEVELFSLDKDTFRKEFLGTFGSGDKITFIIRTSQFLKNLPLFRDFTSKELLGIVSKMELKEVKTGHIVIKQGEIGDQFYILQDGEVEVILEQYKDNRYKEIHLATLGAGSYFGEIALLKDVPRTATVRTTKESTILILSKNDFLGIFKEHLGSISDMLKLTEKRIEEQKKAKEEEE